MHRQLHTQTITCTDNYIHRQLYTQTFTYTDNYIHRQLHTQTITYTNNYIHRQLQTQTITYTYIRYEGCRGWIPDRSSTYIGIGESKESIHTTGISV